MQIDHKTVFFSFGFVPPSCQISFGWHIHYSKQISNPFIEQIEMQILIWPISSEMQQVMPADAANPP